MKRFIVEAAIFIALVIAVELIKSHIIDKGKKDVKFESYVFYDETNTLHTNSQCEGLRKATRYSKARWQNIWQLSQSDIEKMCSRCVSEEQSEYLRNNVIDK